MSIIIESDVFYEQTEIPHIWKVTVDTGLQVHKGYVFSNEAAEFSNEIFATIDSARINLNWYIESLEKINE